MPCSYIRTPLAVNLMGGLQLCGHKLVLGRDRVLSALFRNKGSLRFYFSEKFPSGDCLVFGLTLQTFKKGPGWHLMLSRPPLFLFK